ncbi:hypothetical protein Hanom_Chr15g01398721 [Helianthus anomalus]
MLVASSSARLGFGIVSFAVVCALTIIKGRGRTPTNSEVGFDLGRGSDCKKIIEIRKRVIG